MSYDRADEEEDEGLTGEQAAALHKGAKLTDGPYTLSYDDDGERYYYLKFQGEVHSWTWAFRRVEYSGYFNLAKPESRSGMFFRDIENYPLLRKALITPHRTTPNEARRDRK